MGLYEDEQSNRGVARYDFAGAPFCPPFVFKSRTFTLCRGSFARIGIASDLSCARKTFDGRIDYRDCALVRRGNLIPSTFLYAVGILTPSSLLYDRPQPFRTWLHASTRTEACDE